MCPDTTLDPTSGRQRARSPNLGNQTSVLTPPWIQHRSAGARPPATWEPNQCPDTTLDPTSGRRRRPPATWEPRPVPDTTLDPNNQRATTGPMKPRPGAARPAGPRRGGAVGAAPGRLGDLAEALGAWAIVAVGLGRLLATFLQRSDGLDDHEEDGGGHGQERDHGVDEVAEEELAVVDAELESGKSPASRRWPPRSASTDP